MQSVTAVIVSLVVAGCSSSGPGDRAVSTTQAQSAAPECGHGPGDPGDPVTVSLLAFDSNTLELTGIDANGFVVWGWLTSATSTIPADLGAFPPDPIFPQCSNDAAAYDRVVGDGLTDAAVAQVAQLASDRCNASVTMTRNGTVISFQPVP
jgi:hypothetical protein